MSRSTTRQSRALPALRLIVTLLTFSSVTLGVFVFSTNNTVLRESHKTLPAPVTLPTEFSPPENIGTALVTITESAFNFETAAANDPAQAIALAHQLAATNPAHARDIGYALIAALQHQSAFDSAAIYAAENSEPTIRRDLVIAAFHEWGRHQPDAAWTASIHLADPAARDFATQSVLSGWARSNPQELAETALHFPDGTEKNAALTKALRSWMIKDSEKAGDWILSHEAAIPIAEAFFAADER